jgi:S1-C subfamily serine protease
MHNSNSIWSYVAVSVITAVITAGVTYSVAQVTHPRPQQGVPEGGTPGESSIPPIDLSKIDASPEEKTNIEIYQNVNRSVVNITSRSGPSDEFLSMGQVREGTGSGSVLDKAGHVITNNHVVEGADQITVTLYDGSSHAAKLVGTDPNNDLAVLQLEDAPAEHLFPISWGDSTQLLVGMRVAAIGNPFGLERTFTTGVVSSLNRSLRTENGRIIRGVIQTDAAINPGNSGGPLLNHKGEMVGITTAIISRAGQSSGIGLAIPASMSHRIVDELIHSNGHLVRADAGILSVYETDHGLLIARLVPNGPAARAGLRGPQEVRRFGYRAIDRSKADLITAVDGKPVRSLDDFLSYIESKKPGDKVTLTIVREGKTMNVPVQLEETQA